ncbi:MAG TPA: PIN domain-containing protein [Chloroflexi bacterium]|nr:PIN domain-containing protein [Chloroflexota bacterium]
MNKYLVFDASYAVRIVTDHKDRPVCKALMERQLDEGYVFYAPSLWLYEVTSTINKLARFGELTETEGLAALKSASTLNAQLVMPDETMALQAFHWTRQLNRAAAYDSFYLALAQQLSCDLWTADKRLVNAVRQPWVRLATAQT